MGGCKRLDAEFFAIRNCWFYIVISIMIVENTEIVVWQFDITKPTKQQKPKVKSSPQKKLLTGVLTLLRYLHGKPAI